MSKTITIEAYTLTELREQFPEAFERVHERWREGVDEIPWMEETMESLTAVIRECGGWLRDYSIGADNNNDLSVGGIDDDEQDARWFKANVLKPLGHLKRNGHAHFPGNCALTGYCADDDFLEAVWKSLHKDHETLTEALEGLANVAGRMMEDDLEQQQNEESMMVNWDGVYFTEEGEEI